MLFAWETLRGSPPLPTSKKLRFLLPAKWGREELCATSAQLFHLFLLLGLNDWCFFQEAEWARQQSQNLNPKSSSARAKLRIRVALPSWNPASLMSVWHSMGWGLLWLPWDSVQVKLQWECSREANNSIWVIWRSVVSRASKLQQRGAWHGLEMLGKPMGA